jgi:nucleotide-binding universal stress UspA family protein
MVTGAETRAIRRIVLATDLGADSQEVFAQALGLALQARSELFLLHVAEPDRPDATWRRLPTVRALLERWGRLLPYATDADYRTLGVKVHPVERGLEGRDLRVRVARGIESLRPDLVILSPHVHTLLDRFANGTVSEPVAREVHKPSLFLPPGARTFVSVATGEVKVQRVVVPVGSGVDSGALLSELEQLLVSLGVGAVNFTVVHVGSWATAPLDRMPSRPDWSWRMEVRSGTVVEQILDAVELHRADLVVMGASGSPTLRSRVFGSTTSRVLSRTRCPVLALPMGPSSSGAGMRAALRAPYHPPRPLGQFWA